MPLEREHYLSPFVQLEKATLTAGYRDASSGISMASIELPAELIEAVVLSNISIEIALSGAGEISSTASGTMTDSSAATSISLDKLVEVLLEQNNIRQEETTESELRTLLGKLEKSVRAVQQAIELLKTAAN
ncbi:hypothetical protein ACSHT2_34050 [Bradyrhizobium sp. PUT101]|uniref:hypothetical protein n=1 Tax=Bradyrhizobium sp. PUT101 TaxID=3447427 RepID=UPI003F853568